MTLPKKEYVTLEEYFLLEETAPEKHEYLDGKVVAMADQIHLLSINSTLSFDDTYYRVQFPRSE